MQNQTILITGANGEIGQNLISRLNESSLNNKIIALDLNDNNHSPNIEFIKGSILDKSLIEDIFFNNKINVIFHLAAILSTKAELDPQLAEEVNLGGTQLLIKKSLENNGAVKFFFENIDFFQIFFRKMIFQKSQFSKGFFKKVDFLKDF